METYSFFIKNGAVYLLFPLLFINTNYFMLSSILGLKLFGANYYYTFRKLYDNEYIKFKHLARLTDTGHYAMLLGYFNKEFLPICHNINFIITFYFWSATILMGLTSVDEIKNKEINSTLQLVYTYIHHGLYYSFTLYFLKDNEITFDMVSLKYTYYWILIWLIFIYIPWVLLTNDYIYSIMEDSELRKKAIIVGLCFPLVANTFGYLINIFFHYKSLN